MKYIKPLLVLIIAVSFSSCRKLHEKWIIGEWKVEDLARDSEPPVWIFNEDHSIVLVNDHTWGGDYTDTATWAMKSKLGTSYVEITNSQGSLMDGKFFIDKINSKKVIMTRREFLSGETSQAFLQRELYK